MIQKSIGSSVERHRLSRCTLQMFCRIWKNFSTHSCLHIFLHSYINPQRITSNSLTYWSTSIRILRYFPDGVKINPSTGTSRIFSTPAWPSWSRSMRFWLPMSIRSQWISHWISLWSLCWSWELAAEYCVDWFHDKVRVTCDTRPQTTYMDFLAETLITPLLRVKFGFLQSQPSHCIHGWIESRFLFTGIRGTGWPGVVPNLCAVAPMEDFSHATESFVFV